MGMKGKQYDPAGSPSRNPLALHIKGLGIMHGRATRSAQRFWPKQQVF